MLYAFCSMFHLIMKKPQPIHAILEQTLKSLEIDVPLKSYSIWGAWKEIVGESVALQAQPRSIRNRILFIDVSHSTWMQQLQFFKPTLIEKVNTFIGEPYIKDIRFKLGKISPASSPLSPTPLLKEDDLDKETLDKIETLLQNVRDEETKEGLRNIFMKGAKLERFRRRTSHSHTP